jgi:pimeloyl-ACP methyl ester carboxylesterase
VLGWSMGGFVAQELALRHPKSVRRLVLASTDSGGPKAKQPSARVRRIDDKTTRGEGTIDEILGLLFPKAARQAGNDWFARLLAQPGSCCEVIARKAGDAQVEAQNAWYRRGHGTRERLRKIKAPTLVGAGKLDQDIPYANAHVLVDGIRGARLIAYPDAGHAFLIQHGDDFAARVAAYLG